MVIRKPQTSGAQTNPNGEMSIEKIQQKEQQ
jgi:hypothetical protein